MEEQIFPDLQAVQGLLVILFHLIHREGPEKERKKENTLLKTMI